MSGATWLVQVGVVEQDLVEQREPGGPGVCLAEPLVQFPGHRPEYLGAVHVDSGQFTGGAAEQGPGA